MRQRKLSVASLGRASEQLYQVPNREVTGQCAVRVERYAIENDDEDAIWGLKQLRNVIMPEAGRDGKRSRNPTRAG